ncbi:MULTISPECIES: hypothetical protein [unclassified Bradyrhizobium]|uniref:hypothetical protein n=1 Tax=unclassified Bradyrhizobium TaxID=2631580 RepID=UPI002479BA6B|nr:MULTISPECIES: hypothetical protein [unclassified Bradyrhizobium]WGS18938.1 LamG domain-containing protein [Bradyrhizobium sp. ISRA463]WGS25771.1 LamG domain-containing protein [Bradyrhizobium sp. ISRA464]
MTGEIYMVEFTAESILRCDVEALTTPPPTIPLTPIPELTGLIGWWDASIFDSMTLAVNGTDNAILSIADQSGHGNNLGDPGSGTPSYSATGFNGSHPAMVFSGNGQQALRKASFVFGGGSTLTVFAAASFETGFFMDQSGRLISYTATGQSHDDQNVGSFALARDAQTSNALFVRNSLQTPSTSVGYGTPRRVIATVKADGTMTIYVDGVASATVTSAGTFAATGDLVVGGSRDASIFGHYFHGAIAEIGIATGYHDAATVALLDSYLKSKWGM